jgi:hypothetical protein
VGDLLAWCFSTGIYKIVLIILGLIIFRWTVNWIGGKNGKYLNGDDIPRYRGPMPNCPVCKGHGKYNRYVGQERVLTVPPYGSKLVPKYKLIRCECSYRTTEF